MQRESGTTTSFFREGRRQSAEVHLDEGTVCIRLYWYPNGQLFFRHEYLLDKLHGRSEQWYEDGHLAYQFEYRNGLRQGISREWYDNGQIEVEETYLDGQLHGLSTSWHPNGDIAAQYIYHCGKLQIVRRIKSVYQFC